MDAATLMEDIYKIAKRLLGMKIFNQSFPFNNTEMQMMKEIIRVKEEEGRIISSNLAKELGVTRSAVSQMVNKLEKADVVRRVPDDKDRKIAYIELSENARAVYENIKNKITEVMSEVISELGAEKVRVFLDSAAAFVEAFDTIMARHGEFELPASVEKHRKKSKKAQQFSE